jgi:hypothetical protein
MGSTDNHTFPTPDKADPDYADTFQQFFTQIDERVLISDIESNRSQYTPYEDAKFISTDSGTIYVGNGTSWIDVTTETDPTYTSVSLESGWSITENADDEIVILDTNDYTIYRRDDANDKWVTDTIDIDGIIDGSGTLHTGQLANDGDTQPPETHGSSAHDSTVTEDARNATTVSLFMEVRSTDPSSPSTGRIWIRDDL